MKPDTSHVFWQYIHPNKINKTMGDFLQDLSMTNDARCRRYEYNSSTNYTTAQQYRSTFFKDWIAGESLARGRSRAPCKARLSTSRPAHRSRPELVSSLPISSTTKGYPHGYLVNDDLTTFSSMAQSPPPIQNTSKKYWVMGVSYYVKAIDV